MTPKENKEFIARYFEEFWNGKKLDAANTFYAPNYMITDPAIPTPKKGPDAGLEYRNVWMRLAPDLNFHIEEQFADGDFVVTRLTGTGTHEGDFLGFPPTHRKVTADVVSFNKIENGKIVMSRVMWDTFAFFRDTGLLEKMRSATPATYAR